VESKTLASSLARSSHNFSHRNISTFHLKAGFQVQALAMGKMDWENQIKRQIFVYIEHVASLVKTPKIFATEYCAQELPSL